MTDEMSPEDMNPADMNPAESSPSELPPLDGAAVRLVPLSVDAAPEMAAVLSDQELYRYTGGTPPTVEQLSAQYAHQVRGSGDAAEQWMNWIVRLQDGTAVGYVQATVTPGVAELAWVIGAPWGGRGLAKDAVRAMAAHLHDRGIPRLIAHVHPDHVASQRVAVSIGMRATERIVDGEIQWTSEPDVS